MNCTDVALGPLALIPQCYRTPQGSVRLSINMSDPDVLDLCVYVSADCNESTVDACHTFFNGEPCDCPFFRGLNDSLFVVFEWDTAAIELLIDIIDMFPNYSALHPWPLQLCSCVARPALTLSPATTRGCECAQTRPTTHAGSSSTTSLASPSLATGAVLVTAAPTTAVTTTSARSAMTQLVHVCLML
jgi:hypothetical protein